MTGSRRPWWEDQRNDVLTVVIHLVHDAKLLDGLGPRDLLDGAHQHAHAEGGSLVWVDETARGSSIVWHLDPMHLNAWPVKRLRSPT